MRSGDTGTAEIFKIELGMRGFELAPLGLKSRILLIKLKVRFTYLIQYGLAHQVVAAHALLIPPGSIAIMNMGKRF